MGGSVLGTQNILKKKKYKMVLGSPYESTPVYLFLFYINEWLFFLFSYPLYVRLWTITVRYHHIRNGQ